jgi:RimJ/RimL family protein N-acetyltransferase
MKQRVTLEPLRVDHADEMASVLSDPALYQFTGGHPPTPESLAQRYRSQVAGPGRAGESWLNWIVRRTDTAEPVGFVQATVVDGIADIAWLIGVDHQGQGLAVEAVRSMAKELASLGVWSITAHIHPEHRRSQRVARALGMKPSETVDDDGEEIWTGVATPH